MAGFQPVTRRLYQGGARLLLLFAALFRLCLLLYRIAYDKKTAKWLIFFRELRAMLCAGWIYSRDEVLSAHSRLAFATTGVLAVRFCVILSGQSVRLPAS